MHWHFDEAYLDRVRAYHKTAAYQKAIGKRKVWVEPLFAAAKEWHGLHRFRLRRLWRVNIEALLMGQVRTANVCFQGGAGDVDHSQMEQLSTSNTFNECSFGLSSADHSPRWEFEPVPATLCGPSQVENDA